ncbi:MFS transporter [Alcaligenaceae bacterium SJ-26]|nr:MFS transporter [Alcaligenaceae bacterium SJ-26]
MISTLRSFSALYLATLLMLIGTGLFNTYMALRLTAESVSQLWVGALIAAYYLGLVGGARIGHRILIKVGHIRAYAACAALTTVMVLAQTLVDNLTLWLGFRLIVGMAMVTQFMVLESWLNEQTENHLRGRVFSFYMLVSGLGTVLGQLVLTVYPVLDLRMLTMVAICHALCLMPIALTARMHPATPVPAPLEIMFFLKRVPLSLTALFLAGNLTGAFYGLAPVFAVKQGLDTAEVAIFVAAAVMAGLCAQWPIGWLSDRINRVWLIRFNAIVLAAVVVPMWGLLDLPFWLMVGLSCVVGILLFTLYPLGAAFANDHVEADRRVSLSAVLLMVYGIGACLGPLVTGALMDMAGPGMFFVFFSVCAALLAWRMRPEHVSGEHQVDEAPVQFVPMPVSGQASPAAAALDPRIDAEQAATTMSLDDMEEAMKRAEASAGQQQQDGGQGQGQP